MRTFFLGQGVLIALGILCLCVLATAQTRAFDEDYKQDINGTRLHFRVRGTDKSKPYLLILHGGPGFSAHMFYPWGSALERSVNIVYLDQRSCGESERLQFATQFVPTGDFAKDYTIENLEKIVVGWLAEKRTDEGRDYTLANLIADIEGVREFLKIDKWYVLGHSWGGMLGLEYVSTHPDHVLGYIHMDGLISTPMTQNAMLDNAEARFKTEAAGEAPGEKKERIEGLLTTVKHLRALPLNDPRRFLGGAALGSGPANLYFAKEPNYVQYAELNARAVEAAKPYGVPFTALLPAWEPLAALIRNDRFLTRDDRPLLEKITVPTLILNGKQDGLTTPKMAEMAHARIKNSQLVLLDACGHYPFAEQPDKTAEAVLEFVKQP